MGSELIETVPSWRTSASPQSWAVDVRLLGKLIGSLVISVWTSIQRCSLLHLIAPLHGAGVSQGGTLRCRPQAGAAGAEAGGP